MNYDHLEIVRNTFSWWSSKCSIYKVHNVNPSIIFHLSIYYLYYIYIIYYMKEYISSEDMRIYIK